METVNYATPLLPFTGQVRTARLAARRKRFLVDLEDESSPFTAHTNNTGSMLGLTRPGSAALLSVSQAPGRKHPHTLEAVRLENFWVGVNTLVPTRLLRAAWLAGLLPECANYRTFATEPRFAGGRLDAKLFGGVAGDLFIETKNVTMVEDGVAQFPDAPSQRGRKQLVELMRLTRCGVRAALFFAVQRPDGACFAPAEVIDPQYADLFRQALAAGVEVWPYVVDVSLAGYELGRRLPLAAGYR